MQTDPNSTVVETDQEPMCTQFSNRIPHQEIQQSAPLSASEIILDDSPASAAAVNLFIHPKKTDDEEGGRIGTPLSPVHIRVQRDPEPRYLRILSAMQMMAGIFFVIFFIGVMVSHLNEKGGILDNAVKSHHQIIKSSNIRFNDVQGCDEVKGQLMQVVDFLKNPKKYEDFGATLPRGYLLEGPPGVGKTLLAKAVAGEANVPFLVISGAEFDEVYVGVGASRVRSLFKDAREYKSAVVFIDEIDAVASRRDGLSDRPSSRQTLNQLLVEMDGFRTESNVVVLAATNTVENLDPAIMRPGRFDKTLKLHAPDIAGRKQILVRLFAEIKPKFLGSDLDLDKIAAMTIRYTGADLTNLLNEAKLNAASDGSKGVVSMKHVIKAKHVIDIGAERNLNLTAEDKERTAYHEAGHAIVALTNPLADPITHASIIPRGDALGMVITTSDTDQFYVSRSKMEYYIDLCLGGFMAEERKYGENNVSFGPASDLYKANFYAQRMVESGFGRRTKFLQSYRNFKLASEAYKRDFEADAQDILDEARARVNKVFKDNFEAWEAIAKALLEKESLDRQEVESIYYRISGSKAGAAKSVLKPKSSANNQIPEKTPEKQLH